MSRVEAAARLGAPIVECAECDCIVRRDDAIVMCREGEMTHVPPLSPIGPYLCSLRCVFAHGAALLAPLRAYRWVRRYEHWAELGKRPTGQEWRWNDTGEARWIEENAARLRAAGEIE